MRKLLVLDEHDYTDDMPVYEKNAVRALIRRGNLIAMQIGGNGIYKIPGGAVERDESFHGALIREVAEVTGLIVLPETISEIGEIEEIREDFFQKGQKYISHSFFYRCRIAEETTQTNMTQNEIEKGYQLVWAEPGEIYEMNTAFLKEAWMSRDTAFLKMILDGVLSL